MYVCVCFSRSDEDEVINEEKKKIYSFANLSASESNSDVTKLFD